MNPYHLVITLKWFSELSEQNPRSWVTNRVFRILGFLKNFQKIPDTPETCHIIKNSIKTPKIERKNKKQRRLLGRLHDEEHMSPCDLISGGLADERVCGRRRRRDGGNFQCKRVKGSPREQREESVGMHYLSDGNARNQLEYGQWEEW